MNNWKLILATMVIFGTGVVTGGLLVRRTALLPPHQGPRFPGWARTNAPVSVGGIRMEFLRRAQRDLDLTPEQREKVDRVLKDSQDRTRKIMEPVSPQLREEMQHAKEEFRAVLTPAQRERFDQLLKHQQRPRDPRMPLRERSTDTSAPRPPPGP